MKNSKPAVWLSRLIILAVSGKARCGLALERLGIGVNADYMNYSSHINHDQIAHDYNLDTFTLEPGNKENGGVLEISVYPSFRIGNGVWRFEPGIAIGSGVSVFEGAKLEKAVYYDTVVVGRFTKVKSLKSGDFYADIDVRFGPAFRRGRSEFALKSGLYCSVWSRYFNFVEGLTYDNLTTRRESMGSLYVPVEGRWRYDLSGKTALIMTGGADVMLYGLKLVTNDFWVFGFQADDKWVRLGNGFACDCGISLRKILNRITLAYGPYFRLVKFAEGEHGFQAIRSADGNLISENAVFEPNGIQIFLGFGMTIEPHFHFRKERK
jgi:hypothetical protein